LVKPQESLRQYRWSSYPEYLKAPRKRAEWLRVDRVLGEMSIPKDSMAGRQEFERRMEQRRSAEQGGSYKAIRRGWFFGEQALKKELLGKMSERLGPEHYGQERQEGQEEKAQRVVREELRRRSWTERTLRERRKGDREKVKIARRLREETLVTVGWIAKRLGMGSVANVNTLLYLWRKGRLRSKRS
jgi:hypothetical protein